MYSNYFKLFVDFDSGSLLMGKRVEYRFTEGAVKKQRRMMNIDWF